MSKLGQALGAVLQHVAFDLPHDEAEALRAAVVAEAHHLDTRVSKLEVGDGDDQVDEVDEEPAAAEAKPAKKAAARK